MKGRLPALCSRLERIRQSRWVFFALAVVFVALPTSARSQKVRLGYSGVSIPFLPHLLAKDLGLFTKKGTRFRSYPNGAPVGMNALVAGEIDGFAAIDPGILLAVRGLPVMAVMATQWRRRSFY